jgi:hypothetical protein
VIKFVGEFPKTAAGKILKRAISLDKFLEERIYKPLEMNGSGFQVKGPDVDRLVYMINRCVHKKSRIVDKSRAGNGPAFFDILIWDFFLDKMLAIQLVCIRNEYPRNQIRRLRHFPACKSLPESPCSF